MKNMIFLWILWLLIWIGIIMIGLMKIMKKEINTKRYTDMVMQTILGGPDIVGIKI